MKVVIPDLVRERSEAESVRNHSGTGETPAAR